MIEAYHGGAVPPALLSRMEVYKAMSDLHWSVWGFVQHAKGNPAEDFLAYGLDRLHLSRVRMRSADFSRHVGVVRNSGRPRSPKRARRTDPQTRKPVLEIPTPPTL